MSKRKGDHHYHNKVIPSHRTRTLHPKTAYLEGEGGIRNRGCCLGVSEPKTGTEGARVCSVSAQDVREMAHWEIKS